MKYKFYDNGSKVVAVSSYAGKSVRGVAKCDPRDSFDITKGRNLAEARCNLKVATKRASRAVKCYREAVEVVEEAKVRANKMWNYYADACNAVDKAQKHLDEIEKNM